MNAVFSAIYTFWNQIWYALSNIRIFDVIDILVIAFLIYKVVEFFRESRSGQLAKGIIVILALYGLSVWFEMITLKWLLTRVVSYGIIAVAIVFQPEIRRALERMGRSSISTLNKNQIGDTYGYLGSSIDAICKAAGTMQESKTGALMVIERETLLGEIIDTGTVIDAEATNSLICNIFFPKSPLHDGAMIIRDGRIYAAGCILPLTNNDSINSQLGTRHRAAIGMSENSDAVIIVVSEETGTISVAHDGNLKRDFNAVKLRAELDSIFASNKKLASSSKLSDIVSKIAQKLKLKK